MCVVDQTGKINREGMVASDPDAIAETYWSVMHQHRSAWSWEVEMRPWVERF